MSLNAISDDIAREILALEEAKRRLAIRDKALR